MCEFAKAFDAEGEPVECDCCHYPGRVSMFKDTMCASGTFDLVLCEVCSQSYLSVALKYPLQCPDTKLYQSVAVLGNMLLEAIRGENP